MLLCPEGLPRGTVIEEGQLVELHAYVFTYRNGDARPFFERTFPASCVGEALKWIRNSRYRGFVSVGCLPKFYWR